MVPVIILNWNGWEDTGECLRSLTGAEGITEVWVVDNGSREDHFPALERIYPGLRPVRLQENHGWAGGYNRALAIAAEESCQAAYLLNNDTTVHPRFLVEAVGAVEQAGARWGAIGSRMLLPDGSVYFDGEYPDGTEVHPPATPPMPFPARSANGGGMLISLDAWRDVGPFDEAFFCYLEELDWCLRATARGYTVYHAPASTVWHKVEASDENSNAAYYRARNTFLILRPEPGPRRALLTMRVALVTWVRANQARRDGDHDLARALVDGLHDGVRGRFGKRTPRPRTTLRDLLAWSCPLSLGQAQRLWASMSGRRGP